MRRDIEEYDYEYEDDGGWHRGRRVLAWVSSTFANITPGHQYELRGLGRCVHEVWN
jgi:hypothetical protein